MSYWQGVRGKNPMRYAGGLFGGSWLTALMSDLGDGKIDGTALILNFDILNPANWLWGKQYDVWTHVDTDAARYLKFEQWWGDFIQLNGDELQFLVDNLFIGDKLTRNQIKSSDGTTFDLRRVTSPIIVFTSMGDNISPPQETLGWILDLYCDVEDIRTTGLNAALGEQLLYIPNAEREPDIEPHRVADHVRREAAALERDPLHQSPTPPRAKNPNPTAGQKPKSGDKLALDCQHPSVRPSRGFEYFFRDAMSRFRLGKASCWREP
jgi:hypothetical protein